MPFEERPNDCSYCGDWTDAHLSTFCHGCKALICLRAECRASHAAECSETSISTNEN